MNYRSCKLINKTLEIYVKPNKCRFLLRRWTNWNLQGGPRGSSGGPGWSLGVPGSSLGAFWAPWDDQQNIGAHFVGSQDSFRSVKKWLEIVLSRSWRPNSNISMVLSMPTLRVWCSPWQLIWVPWVLWGSLRGSRGGFGGAQGGQKKKVPRTDGSRDLPETEKQCFGWLVGLAYVLQTLQI